MTDRRASVRFEVVGRLSGTLTAERHVVLHDISGGGALIETLWPVPQDSLVVMRLESQTRHSTIEARVRRVRPALDREAFLIALQFTAEDAAEELELLIPAPATDAQPN